MYPVLYANCTVPGSIPSNFGQRINYPKTLNISIYTIQCTCMFQVQGVYSKVLGSRFRVQQCIQGFRVSTPPLPLNFLFYKWCVVLGLWFQIHQLYSHVCLAVPFQALLWFVNININALELLPIHIVQGIHPIPSTFPGNSFLFGQEKELLNIYSKCFAYVV